MKQNSTAAGRRDPIGRRHFLAMLGAASVAPLGPAGAQDRLRHVGALIGNSRDAEAALHLMQPFRGALKALGWIEGQNIAFNDRFAGGDPAAMHDAAAQLVALRPDVIYAISQPALDAVFRETRTIPIVFSQVTDPIGPGYVVSLAHPEGNVTGFTSHQPSLAGKWVQLLRETAPAIRSIGLLYNPHTAPFAPDFVAVAERAAGRPVGIVRCAVESDQDIDAAIAGLARGRGGLIVLAEPFTSVHVEHVIAETARRRVPALYGGGEAFVRAGGLMSYAFNQSEGFREPAAYVSRILKGEKAGDLPVQTPTKYDLVINLKTAKALGLTVPTTLLATADAVIE